ncbi:MAG TPA: glycosyltransferase [Planctomycetota bacterium]|nr:glycosyltransferase [Planctomycetota bacterium]
MSILLAGRNTRPFLELCIRSLRANLSRGDHHLLVLDDASSDGSAEWLEEHRAQYGYELELHRGPERLGIVGAYNRLVEAARTQAVWMVHTDMYFAPGADEETAKYLAPGTVCTCTRVEPPVFGPAAFKIVVDLGVEPSQFREAEFLRLAKDRAEPGRFTEGIFAPVMCRREDFLAVGGLDPAFAPQSREDSDLFNRMALAGYRFRQSWSAFCYHFAGRGSRKKGDLGKDSPEWQATNHKNERNFIRRWGRSVRHDDHLKPIVVPKRPLSLVGLLGHEAENVGPFLENLEPFFDEIVLVADGPQPEAVAGIEEYLRAEEAKGPTLLKRDKIKVYERALAGDFAAQRNFGQERCSSDWVLHADLDERFDRGLLESLQDTALSMEKTGKTVCGFPRINYLDGVVVNDLPRGEWTPDGLKRARTPDQLRNLDPQFRFLRRDVRWHRKVHETPEPLGRDREVVTFCPSAAIRHPKTLERQRRQDARYESIAAGASLRPVEGRVDGLRLLVLATEYPPARGFGLARYTAELSAALARQGMDVHVACMNYNAGKPLWRHEGVTVHLATDVGNPRHYSWVSESVIGNLWMLERAEQVIRERGPFDLLMAHDWLGALAAKALKVAHELPLVFFMHDTEPGKRGGKMDPEQTYIAQIEAWACAYADMVVANSRFIADELVRFHRVRQDKVRVITPGVNPGRFANACHTPDFRALFAPRDEKLVLFVGRLSPMKGVDLLVEAVPEVLAQRPKTRFLVAGEGVLREKLDARVKELGLTAHVTMVGHLAGKVLNAAYRAADLLVVPSRYEPFGMVALEALSCGTPVIAADTGGLREIVPTEEPCRRFAADNLKALVTSLTEALKTEPNEAQRLALREIAGRYSWDRAASEVLEVCRMVGTSCQEVLA